jgi:hypothetical protein
LVIVLVLGNVRVSSWHRITNRLGLNFAFASWPDRPQCGTTFPQVCACGWCKCFGKMVDKLLNRHFGLFASAFNVVPELVVPAGMRSRLRALLLARLLTLGWLACLVAIVVIVCSYCQQ